MSASVEVRRAAPEDYEACFELRRRVFMVEQGISQEEEFDGRDHDADMGHLIALVDGVPMGTMRLWFKPGELKIQRVCVLSEARGKRLGEALMRKALEVAADTDGVSRATLDSQTYAIPFYERLGFVAEGPEFDDAGIPHRFMSAPVSKLP